MHKKSAREKASVPGTIINKGTESINVELEVDWVMKKHEGAIETFIRILSWRIFIFETNLGVFLIIPPHYTFEFELLSNCSL